MKEFYIIRQDERIVVVPSSCISYRIPCEVLGFLSLSLPFGDNLCVSDIHKLNVIFSDFYHG